MLTSDECLFSVLRDEYGWKYLKVGGRDPLKPYVFARPGVLPKSKNGKSVTINRLSDWGYVEGDDYFLEEAAAIKWKLDQPNDRRAERVTKVRTPGPSNL
jgi:hypothetical protein